MYTDQPAPSARLSWWFLAPGLFFIFGTAILTVRLVWEHTALSWERGPQMVGFSLAHGIGVILLFYPLLLAGWLVGVLPYLCWRYWKVRRIAPISLLAICSSIALLVILSLPGGFWTRLFIHRFASSPHAVEFLNYAAATRDLDTVKALLANGLSVNARDREGKTALHGAAVEGNLGVIAFLIAQGADVNAISLWGDSPLEEAVSMKHDAAAAYLTTHGAKLIRGTEEQHNKAAETIAREDIEKMDARLKPVPPPQH